VFLHLEQRVAESSVLGSVTRAVTISGRWP
jgi:hypothetical protein